MEQIIVKHIDGSTFILQSKEYGSTITKAMQSVELLGADVVDITVESATKMEFFIGDKITVYGRDYTLNMPAKEKKSSSRQFSYDLHFEGAQYDMMRVQYSVNVETTSNQIQDLNGDALTGDLKMFLDVLISNLNRVFPGKWFLGAYPSETETRNETFSDTDNCLSVIQSLCLQDKYNTEFSIDIDSSGNRTINIGPVGHTFPFTFEYGKSKGIYELTREKQSSSNIITRLNVFGSSRNIDASKYGSMRLCMPGKNKASSFLEDSAAISRFGVWENSKTFEEVYPNRIGTVTHVPTFDTLTFTDNTMDFDLNARNSSGETLYLISGNAAKVHFNTGKLAGYEFSIQSYDHSTKTFKILSQKDENGYIFPSPSSEEFQMAEGDKYVLIDINMPQSYIDAAEYILQTKGQEWLNKYKQPNVQYGLNLDRFFLKDIMGAEVETNILWVGDSIPVFDADMNIDGNIRLKSFTRDLIDGYTYTITISDIVTSYSFTNQVINSMKDMTKVIRMNNLKDPAKARRDYLAAQEVLDMIFDPEGDFYTDKIKPQSIDTTMLSVGAKSMQFCISGLIMQVNYNAEKNRIVYSEGVLTHYTVIDSSGIQRVWNIVDGDVTLGSDAAYYIYAKCTRSGTGASLLFSTSKITVEQDGAFYHFLIGIANSVGINNERAISLMYGFSTINGRFIKTGRIQSADGETYFDLDSGELRGDFKFKSGVSVASTITNMLNEAYLYSDAIKSNLQAQIDGQIISWFKQYNPTLLNLPAVDWDTEELRNQHANDTFTNLDTGGCWRFQYNGTAWEWGVIADTATQQALVLAGRAQDTADGKRRVFTAQPTAPYEIGDLWVQGSAGDIMKCSTTRLTPIGAYYSSDWSKASKYTDDTTASAAQSAANAANTAAANALAEAVALAYLKNALGADTEISGGLLSTSVILMRTVAGLVTGGLSGLDDDNIGLWTGGTYAQALANAAKIVLRKDGSGYLAGGKISFDSIGKILVGPFNINPESMSNGTTTDNMYMDKDGIQFYNQANSTWAGIGKNVDPISGMLAVSKFQCDRTSTDADSYNVGVESTASGATHNYAIFAPFGKIVSRKGGLISWDDSYIGDAAADTIEKNFKDCSQFLFSTISTNGINVRLPSSDVIPSGITFKIDILVSASSNVLYIKSVSGGQIKNWDNNDIDTLEMDPGDSITLRYYNGKYHLISWMK